MHPTLRRPVLLVLLAVLMTLMGATPTAGAHGVLDEEGPVLVGNLQSLITARNVPAGVSAELLENGYVLRLVNHSSQDITAHVFGADAGIGTEPPRVPAGVTQLWIGAPSAVTDEDTHAAERVKAGGRVRAWAVELTDADGGQFTVRGVISRLAAPSPAWLVAGVLAILVVVALGALRRPARSAPAAGSELKVRVPPVPIGVALACAVVGLAVETTATLWARAAGEGMLATVREYLPQSGACLLGVVAFVLTWRGHRMATVLAVITAFTLGAGVVSRWRLLWSSVAVSRLPISVDRVLTLAISAAALLVAVLVVLGEVRKPSTANPADQLSGAG